MSSIWQACTDILKSRWVQAEVAILDEIDSGLDIDALREVASAVNGLKSQQNATILVTHYKVFLLCCCSLSRPAHLLPANMLS